LAVAFAPRRLRWSPPSDGTDYTDCRMSATVPRVLVVDDEPQLLRGIRIILRSAGYAMETARTTSKALAILPKRPPDVMVLDLILPDGEGAEVCSEVRRCSKLPILILSAAGEQRDVVRALDAGADDYLAKPFSGHELLARLRAVLRRSADGRGSSTLEIGEMAIDLARRRVICDGATVLLAPIEFELVRILAQNRGRLVTDGQLLRAVWGDQRGQETDRLRVAVARLRAKLERDPSRPEYLIAEPGIGYRLGGPGEVAR
jgi:two-component system, OmpR family, KDP operon response regulator KdpE